MPANIRDNIVFSAPKTYEERCKLASMCESGLGIEFPAVVDTMDNKTEAAYAAAPDRLYVVGQDGRIVYKSRPGPRGFRSEEVRQALERMFGGG